MPLDTLFQLVLFAMATLYTPGPNNIMLASSGARFGFRRSIPHVLGVSLGFPMMLFPIAMGLGALFEQSALFREVLRYVGAAVMLYIGWKIATAKAGAADDAQARPFTFAMAAGFQWINPKAWSMAIGVAGSFVVGASPVVEAALCAGVFALLGVGSAALWTGFGVQIRQFLSTPWRFRVFNITMGLAVAACVILLFID